MSRLDWPTVLGSALAAALFSVLLTFSLDIFYYKPYQRQREQVERSRTAVTLVLDPAIHLHRKFGALFMLPTIPATATNEAIREQAKTLLLLADSVSDACLRQPFVTGACGGYSTWTKEAVPLFEQLVSSKAKPLSALDTVTEGKRELLTRQLDEFIAALKLLLEKE